MTPLSQDGSTVWEGGNPFKCPAVAAAAAAASASAAAAAAAAALTIIKAAATAL
jgi:hypothetical protein